MAAAALQCGERGDIGSVAIAPTGIAFVIEWCRLIAWTRRSEPVLGPHQGLGFWRRSPSPS